jgi:photosystem II oxygen-evolving enhancer protein 2
MTMTAATTATPVTTSVANRRNAARGGRRTTTTTRAFAKKDDVEAVATRREALAKTLAVAVCGVNALGGARPAAAISGMNVTKDTREGYEFLYPVGWQEVQVDGQTAVFKDIIEPLESVALNVYPTQRETVADIGTAEEVANTLVGKALTAPGALAKVLATSERKDKDGHLYYQFEFVTKTKSYERHALTVVTVTQGKFYTLTTGASEKRWNKMKDRLAATVGSFTVYY